MQLHSVRLAGLVALLTGAVLCALPLFNVIGAESALVISVLLSPFGAAVGARLYLRQLRHGQPRLVTPLFETVLAAWGLVCIPLILLMINAVRVRWCEPLQSLSFYMFGPVISVPLAGMVGCVVASLVRSGTRATLLAIALPVFEIVTVLHTLWSEPGIFAYGHFFGYFPGTLYDLNSQFPVLYSTFRMTSLLMLMGFVLCGLGAQACQQSKPRAWIGFGGLAAGISCLVLLVFIDKHAAQIGYATSRPWIKHTLGFRVQGKHCDLYVPREIARDEARRLLQECDFRVTQHATHLGIKPTKRVSVYFFRSADEKRALAGASETMFAKPWRHEAYLQLMSWPHPVLAHELAHVVAADVGRGPFRIAGKWNGLWPEPALIEGTAVALAWGASDGLTPHAWVKALSHLGKAPSYEEVFGASFLRQAPNQAYTVAGSILRYVLEHYGSQALRRWYTTADIAQAIGKTPAQLQAEWHAFISRQDVPASALELARDRFARPGIFSQVCPHRLAELRELLKEDVQTGDVSMALQTCGAILDIEKADPMARVTRIWANARRGRLSEATSLLAQLRSDPNVQLPLIAESEAYLADALWVSGHVSQAQALYAQALQRPLSVDKQRMLQVQYLGVQAKGAEATQFRALFANSQATSPSPAEVMYVARHLSEVRSDGLGSYLEARQLIQSQAFEPAISMLEQAIKRGLPRALLLEEAERLLGVALVAAEQYQRAEQFWQKRLANSTTDANQFEASDWLERIRYLTTTDFNYKNK